MPHSHEHGSHNCSNSHSSSHSHSGSHSHEDFDSHSHEGFGSHEHGCHNEHHFYKKVSLALWGDDQHQHEARTVVHSALIVLVIVVVVIVAMVVVCCRRRRARQACKRRQMIRCAVLDPATNPKAIEAYGPGGLSPSVVVSVCPNDPLPQGTDGEKKDPRLTEGVWSPPPAYEAPQ